MATSARPLRLICYLLALCLMAVDTIIADEAQTDAASAEEPLEIYVEDNADPFSRPDGSGFANEVVQAAFAVSNIAIKLVVVPYARCKRHVIDGGVAACFSMSLSPELAGRVQFSDQPLFTVTPVYFERTATPLNARAETALGNGVDIGIVRDYEYPDSALLAKQRGAIFHSHRSEQTNLKMLATGRLDTALVMTNDLTGLTYWPSVAGVSDQVRAAFASEGRQVAYIGFSLIHPQGRRALAHYNRGLAQLQENGMLEQIRRKWQTTP